jgi:hypothetical protein
VENENYRKESTRTTVWKTSIAQNINENYSAENEHNRKKPRALRWATRSLQKRINLIITVGTKHSAGKRLFPLRSNGVERKGEQKERFPYTKRQTFFLLRKRNYVYLANAVLNQVPMVRVWRSCAKIGELFWFDSQGSRVFGERVRVFFGCANRSPWGGGLAKEKVRTVGGGKVQGEW